MMQSLGESCAHFDRPLKILKSVRRSIAPQTPKSRKYYTAFAQSLMSEQPLKKPATVFASLNEAVAARDRLLQS